MNCPIATQHFPGPLWLSFSQLSYSPLWWPTVIEGWSWGVKIEQHLVHWGADWGWESGSDTEWINTIKMPQFCAVVMKSKWFFLTFSKVCLKTLILCSECPKVPLSSSQTPQKNLAGKVVTNPREIWVPYVTSTRDDLQIMTFYYAHIFISGATKVRKRLEICQDRLKILYKLLLWNRNNDMAATDFG